MAPSLTGEDVEPIAAALAFPRDETLLADASATAASLAESLGVGDLIDPTAIPSTGAAFADPPSPADREPTDPYHAFLDRFPSPKTAAGTGPLAGIRVGVKDLVAVAGLETTCGLAGIAVGSQRDAPVVERLLEAGAGIVGTTNMDAFAIGPGGLVSEFGPVENPVAPDRVSGGSSSGSAAAVAGGLVDAAIGTDTGGSVRKPAAYCGLVGHKPTHGRIPTDGVVDLAPGLDTVGPLAPDVDTTAALFGAMAGTQTPRRSWAGADRRVGVPRGFIEDATEPVRSSFEEAVDRLDDEGGMTIDRVDLGTDVDERCYPVIMGSEFAWMNSQAGVHHGVGAVDPWSARVYRAVIDRGFNAHIAGRILGGAAVDRLTRGQAYLAAMASVEAFAMAFERTIDRVDALFMPTTPVLPPERSAPAADRQVGQSANTRPWNLLGTPALTVPLSSVDDVPIGGQIVTRRGRDAQAFALGRVLETVV